MVRTTFLTICIILWLLVATYVGVVALLAAFRRRPAASVPPPRILPAGLTPGSQSGIGASQGSMPRSRLRR